MRSVALPEYLNPVDRFLHCETPEVILDIVNSLPEKIISLDTESYYDVNNPGVIRFINGSKNNVPFGASITIQQNEEYKSFWVPGKRNILKLKPLIEDQDVIKILHNSKYDRHMLKNIGIDLNGYVWDTMVMIHLIDEQHTCKMPDGTYIMSKALKNLGYHYIGEGSHYYEALVEEVRRVIALNSGRAKSDVSYKEVNDAAPLIMKDYACFDTELTYKLWHIFLQELVRQDLTRAYVVDINATYAAFEMERVGVGVDMEYFTSLEKSLETQQREITDKISTIIPVELNIRSAKDLVEGFRGLGVEWLWHTEKGELKTDDRVLKQFTEGPAGELASLVLAYREVAKLKDTFIAQIKEYVQGDRIHADFNICPRDDSRGGTVTGRLSSNSPNLHNLPKDDTRIRKGIVPAPGFFFAEYDYDQQEYRLLAHYARDKAFEAIVKAGKDIHQGTADMLSKATGTIIDRKKGKNTNFAMVYGLGIPQLASSLGYKIDVETCKKANAIFRKLDIKPWVLPHVEDIVLQLTDSNDKKIMRYYFSEEAQSAMVKAKALKEKYFAQFPDIQVFIKNASNAAKRRGWVKTWTGRRRHFKRPYEEGYKAPNAIIQGGCGDIIKIKMHEVGEFLRKNNCKSRAVNNIHDALLFEIAYGEEHILPDIRKILQDLPFTVPITCGLETSPTSWADLEKVEEKPA